MQIVYVEWVAVTSALLRNVPVGSTTRRYTKWDVTRGNV